MKRKILLFVFLIFLLLLLGGVALRPLPAKIAEGEAATALPVLVYHAVHLSPFTSGSPTEISVARFASHMRYLYEQGYRTLSMEEVADFIQGKKFPPKVVAITFDDNLTSSLYAVPLLVHYGFQATFFIVAGLAEPDPARPGADNLHMSWSTLALLDKVPGIDLQSHTLTHPWEKGKRLTDWITGVTEGKAKEDARFELTESKKRMEERLGYSVSALAWPTGIYDDTLVNMAKEAGYKELVTTNDSFNKPGDNPLYIHRTIIDGDCDLEIFKKILADGKYHGC